MRVPIEVTPKPVSPSAYTLRVNDCPKRYQLQRVIRVPETPGVYLAGGDTLHVVTAALDFLMEHGATEQEATNIALREAENLGLSIAWEVWVSDDNAE